LPNCEIVATFNEKAYQNLRNIIWITDDTFAVASEQSTKIRKIISDNIQELKEINDYNMNNNVLSISPTEFAFTYPGGEIDIWDTKTLEKKFSLTGNLIQEGSIYRLNDTLFTITHKNVVMIYEITDFGVNMLYSLEEWKSPIKNIHSAGVFAIAWDENKLVRWNFKTGEILSHHESTHESNQRFIISDGSIIQPFGNELHCICFNPSDHTESKSIITLDGNVST